jgi:hypothetical protein
MIAEATPTVIAAPSREGATLAVALAFTTPDGGKGEIHGYYAHHWLIAAVTGSKLATSPARPENPAGKAFLASLALHPLPDGNRTYELATGALEIPAAAWSIGKQPNESDTISEEIFLSPATGAWIGVRELAKKDRCDFLAGKVAGAPPDLGDRLKTIYTNATLTNIERAPYGDVSVYANADSGTMHVELLFSCSGDTVLQLSVGGTRPHAELRTQLDAIMKSLKKR